VLVDEDSGGITARVGADPGREPVRDDIADGRLRWERRFAAAEAAGRVRDADYTTLSGMTVDPVYGPAPGDVVADFERIGWPGEFPFTRGLHATGYRGKPWTIRQFAGFVIDKHRLRLSTGAATASVKDIR